MEFGIKQFIRKYLSEFLTTHKSELNKDDKSQECYNFIIDKFHNYLDKELLEIGESSAISQLGERHCREQHRTHSPAFPKED